MPLALHGARENLRHRGVHDTSSENQCLRIDSGHNGGPKSSAAAPGSFTMTSDSETQRLGAAVFHLPVTSSPNRRVKA
ncbi:hypothetical protein H6P81_016263 [Aristolochia fimbriata]|uniref:Uncharacterized protein n=1 Tax=Aristolochia fimbriata TaxID=158543 RepID=A0AAV7E7X2_ARIFI|nr:hypothetical protein H6P81_016263 [Aristolochia fimbriata]